MRRHPRKWKTNWCPIQRRPFLLFGTHCRGFWADLWINVFSRFWLLLLLAWISRDDDAWYVFWPAITDSHQERHLTTGFFGWGRQISIGKIWIWGVVRVRVCIRRFGPFPMQWSNVSGPLAECYRQISLFSISSLKIKRSGSFPRNSRSSGSFWSERSVAIPPDLPAYSLLIFQWKISMLRMWRQCSVRHWTTPRRADEILLSTLPDGV